jgi:hypothetical protein
VPDELDCWARTDAIVQYTGSALQATTWKANGPYNLFGPQANWTGAFAANVPAGAAEMLQSTTAVPAGATGLYSSSTIEDITLNLEVIANPGANTPASYVFIVPSLTADLSAVPTPVLREQRGVVIGTIPGQVNTNAAPVMEPSRFTLSFSMSDLFGVPRNVVRDNPNYAQIPLVNPTVLGYIHVIIAAVDGVTTINFNVRHNFLLHHVLRRPNIMNSSTPI